MNRRSKEEKTDSLRAYTEERFDVSPSWRSLCSFPTQCLNLTLLRRKTRKSTASSRSRQTINWISSTKKQIVWGKTSRKLTTKTTSGASYGQKRCQKKQFSSWSRVSMMKTWKTTQAKIRLRSVKQITRMPSRAACSHSINFTVSSTFSYADLM